MKKNIPTSYAKIFFLFIFLSLLLVGSALAESPWKWQMTLADKKPGDAMYMPAAVSFDPVSERYYAVDAGNSRLVSFNRKGELLKAFSADGKLLAPFDMVRLDNGQLWVVEKGRNSITRIDIAARKVEPILLEDGDRQVFPDRIAEVGGKLYVLDRASGQVLVYNTGMEIERRFGCPECLGGIIDFAVDKGTVWGLDAMEKNIYHFGLDGTISKTITLGTKVGFPVSLALGKADPYIYVLDRSRGKIVVFSRDGRFQYEFLGKGQGQAQLFYPRQIRFDPWGHLCVVDEGNGQVKVYRR